MASIIKADTLQSTTANVFILNSSGTEYARFDSSGVFQLANPTTFPAGTAAAPSITATGDTNTGLYFPAADTIGFVEGGTEVARFDSSGNFGIGTSSPVTKLHTATSGNTPIIAETTGGATSYLNLRNTGGQAYIAANNNALVFAVTANATEAARIDSSGNLLFNSGYGSVATAYGCRAWVNFNGTGVVAIRASGNVSSLTDNGTGAYTINFTNAMPDANYSAVASVDGVSVGNPAEAMSSIDRGNTSSGAKVTTIATSGSATDYIQVNVAIFR